MEIQGGKYPVLVQHPVLGTVLCAVVDGTIVGLTGRGERWTFKSKGQPLAVEDHPFSLTEDGLDAHSPGMLAVRLAGADQASVLCSSDDYETWLPTDQYWAKLRRDGLLPEVAR